MSSHRHRSISSSPSPSSPSLPTTSGLALGSRVTVPAGDGTIRFIGPTSFAQGPWVGVELYEPNGKNDGAVQGKRYFECEPGCGIFLRPGQVRLTEEDAMREKFGEGPGMRPSVSLPSAAVASTGLVGRIRRSVMTNAKASKRQSMPPPAATSGSNLDTPEKGDRQRLVVRPSGSRQSFSSCSPISTPSSPASSSASVSGEKSPRRMGSPGQHQQQYGNKPSPAAPRPVKGGITAKRGLRIVSSPADKLKDQPRCSSSSLDSVTSTPRPVGEYGGGRADAIGQMSESENRGTPEGLEEVEELRRRIFYLEDILARAGVDAGSCAGNVERKEGGLAESPSTSGLRDLPPRDFEQSTDGPKTHDSEHSDREQGQQEGDEDRHTQLLETLEMITLDKEMAEEKAEGLEVEIEVLKEKLEELRLDVEVVKGEKQLLLDERQSLLGLGEDAPAGGGNDGSDEEGRVGQVYVKADVRAKMVQLQSQNERLKQALLKLRDSSHAKEKQLEEQVSLLEDEAQDLRRYRNSGDTLRNSLEAAEIQIKELGQALEDSLGAEHMVEALAEKNLALNDRVDYYCARVEDLEALNRVADEIEANHLETERQLQAEVDVKNKALMRVKVAIDKKDETLADYEKTIKQFQALTQSLQSDLTLMQRREETHQTRHELLSSQTQTMMRLNAQLQRSISKSVARGIDLELRNLEAEQGRIEMEVVRSYLPTAFFATERDAVACLLLMGRIAEKSRLAMRNMARDAFPATGSPPFTEPFMRDERPTLTQLLASDNKSESEPLEKLAAEQESPSFAGLQDILQRKWSTSCIQSLNQLANLAALFLLHIRMSDSETFATYAKVYHDLVVVERRLDALINVFRHQGEIGHEANSFSPWKAEITRFVSQLEHLAETYIIPKGHSLVLTQLIRTYNQHCADRSRAMMACISLFSRVLQFVEKTTSQAAHVKEIQDRLLSPLTSSIASALQAIESSCRDVEERIGVLSVPEISLPLLSSQEPLTSLVVGVAEGTSTPSKAGATVKDIEVLDPALVCPFQDCSKALNRLERFADNTIAVAIDKIDGRVTVLPALTELESLVIEATSAEFGLSADTLPWQTLQVECRRVSSDLDRLLQTSLLTHDAFVKAPGPDPAPWTQRAEAIASQSTDPVELEKKVSALEESAKILSAEVRKKDTELEDHRVKILLLERKLAEARRRADEAFSLEVEVKTLNEELLNTTQELESTRADMEAVILQADTAAAKRSSLRLSQRRSFILDSRSIEGDLDMLSEQEGHHDLGSTIGPLQLDAEVYERQINALRRALAKVRQENARLKNERFRRAKGFANGGHPLDRLDRRREDVRTGDQMVSESEKRPQTEKLRAEFQRLRMEYALYCARRRVVKIPHPRAQQHGLPHPSKDGKTASSPHGGAGPTLHPEHWGAGPPKPQATGWRSTRALPEYEFLEDQLAMQSLQHRLRLFHESLPRISRGDGTGEHLEGPRHHRREVLVGRLKLRAVPDEARDVRPVKCLMTSPCEALELQKLFVECAQAQG